MRCRKVEKLIISSLDEQLDEQMKNAIEEHLSNCQKCSKFREDIIAMRKSIESFFLPEPPAELLERTQLACENQLGISKLKKKAGLTNIRFLTLPWYIWAASAGVVIFTLIWAFPYVKDFLVDEVITYNTTMVFSLIIQNLTMLIFAPLLIKRYKRTMYSAM